MNDDSMQVELLLRYRAQPATQYGFEPWDPVPDWTDYKEHLYLLLESVKQGAKDTLSWGEIGAGSVEVCDHPTTGNMLTVRAHADAFALPIPEDGSAWKTWTEFWEYSGNPDSRIDVEVDTVVFVRTPLQTATDSLTYMMTGNVTRSDISYFHNLQRTYPLDMSLNVMLFHYYYNAESCDSVSEIGSRILAVLDTVSFPVYASDDGNFFDEIEERIDDICVDGYAQPQKYSGLFRAED
ncbi:hypothetical protein KQI52_13385 [bacterium]|nr:hypothetical protein [bacterium]